MGTFLENLSFDDCASACWSLDGTRVLFLIEGTSSTRYVECGSKELARFLFLCISQYVGGELDESR